VLALLILTGCNPTADQSASKPLDPKVTPPVIQSAGVLRIGVDLAYPPFAGTVGEEQAGLDIDVGSALAARLGLKPEFVDVKRSQIASAIAENRVDVALSAPFSDDVLSRATIAGTYIADGPALFARTAAGAAEGTTSVLASDTARIGTQQGSESDWALLEQRDPEAIATYATLRDAFDALTAGSVDFVAADEIVGAYLARDRSGVRYAGALGPGHLLGVAVSADNSKLAGAVRGALDGLASDGVLDTIRTAWVGSAPKPPLPSVDDSGSAETTALP
jgi:polar amino acid transport system substrate-binding protein